MLQMTVATYDGLLPARIANATDWREIHWFNFFRKYELVDGSFYRGVGPLMRRTNSEGLLEYRKLTTFEAEDLSVFEQQW
jgi:hypothetical protein